MLSHDESKHCTKVLRKAVGDIIYSTDGKGGKYELRITSVEKGQCQFEIIDKEILKTRDYYIHIAIAPTKSNDRMEWFVEKSTELGIDEITFLLTEHSERPRIKLDRLKRIAISAMKQCKEYYLPKINELVPFKEFIESDQAQQKFIAHVHPEEPSTNLNKLVQPGKHYSMLIGPEGDFSQQEIQLAIDKNYLPVSLGPKVLRTETAGIAACHIMNLNNY